MATTEEFEADQLRRADALVSEALVRARIPVPTRDFARKSFAKWLVADHTRARDYYNLPKLVGWFEGWGVGRAYRR